MRCRAGRAAAAEQFGFAAATLDWRELAADPRVQAVSITAPNFLHREIGVAMAEAGKHLWIEKPVGLSAADADAVADAARRGRCAERGRVQLPQRARRGGRARTDRRAVSSARVTHVPFRMLSDYAAHPDGALTWRYERERGGSGVLGDLASHGVDLARYLLGDIEALVADTATFIPERARPTGATSRALRWPPAANSARWRTRTTPRPAALRLRRRGARWRPAGSPSASRTTTASSVHGTGARVSWDFRRMGELGSATAPRTRTSR